MATFDLGVVDRLLSTTRAVRRRLDLERFSFSSRRCLPRAKSVQDLIGRHRHKRWAHEKFFAKIRNLQPKCHDFASQHPVWF
jgi:hypothetical protein